MSFVVKLNGSNYVSEERKSAFEEALQDGHQVKLQHEHSSNGNGASAPNPVAPSPARSHPAPVAGPLDNGLLENLERGLARSYEHQKQTLRVHEQYLHNQGDYASIFSQLMQQQQALFANGSVEHAEATLRALENISRSIEQFHEHQSDTLGVHHQFLDHQATYAQAFIRLLQQQCEAMLQGERRVEWHSDRDNGRVGDSVNQRMGESANQRMDVGRNGIPTDEAPEPPSTAPEDVGRNGIPTDEASEPPAAPVSDASPSAALEIDVETLTQSLLDTVSDKTGYPPEMLELDMDMEADLGIDSIKRVEILSALQDRHPELPEIGAEALTELRTLGQIVEHTQGLMAGESTSERMDVGRNGIPTDEAPEPPSTAPEDVGRNGIPTDEALEPPAAPVSDASPSAALEIDVETLTQSLLTTVGDKTGYPPEMLALDMDMEADLGIDSIKRVEILSALQDRRPELPEIDAEALTELRTLGQIVDFMGEERSAEKKV